jgi:hypothetical protein
MEEADLVVAKPRVAGKGTSGGVKILQTKI